MSGCCQTVPRGDDPEVQSDQRQELQELLVSDGDWKELGENGKARMQEGTGNAKNKIIVVLFGALLWLLAHTSGGTNAGDPIRSNTPAIPVDGMTKAFAFAPSGVQQNRDVHAPLQDNKDADPTISPVNNAIQAAIIPHVSNATASHNVLELRIDPAVYKDPFMAEYPDEETIAVQNAKFLARKVKHLFDVDGFEVKSEGNHVGFFPVMYIGFPKHGTSSAFTLMQESMPCLIDRRKETHFWSRMFMPVCQHKDKRITSCEDGSIVKRITQYLSGGDYRSLDNLSNEKQMLKNGRCQPPFWLDFSPLTMYERTIRLPYEDGHLEVPCDQMVLIREITPKARFLALAKEWRTDLLRSAWWYYHPTGTGKQYRQDLEEQQEQLDKAMRMGSVCQGQFELHFNRPATNSWAGSCNLAAAVKLFGEDRVFLTEVGPLMRCETDFNRWFATGVGRDLGVESSQLRKYGLECEKPPKEKTHSHSHKREEKEITPQMVKLEDKLLATLNDNFLPLLWPDEA